MSSTTAHGTSQIAPRVTEAPARVRGRRAGGCCVRC